MTPEEQARFDELLHLIVDEKDHDKFLELVRELNDLLGRKEQRLEAAS